MQLTPSLSEVIPDPHNLFLITHPHLALLKQRIYGIALEYEDLNDNTTLRNDPAFQTAVEREEVLASSSTLCRLENRQARRVAWNIHKVFLEKFIQSFQQAPDQLILDFDATDDPVDGEQEGRFFHGYYREYCFLSLYVFCGEQLLVSYLRTSHQNAARHAWAILALLVSYDWWANQFRLLLSSAAYILISGIRRLALFSTELANEQCGTIQLKLFKLAP